MVRKIHKWYETSMVRKVWHLSRFVTTSNVVSETVPSVQCNVKVSLITITAYEVSYDYMQCNVLLLRLPEVSQQSITIGLYVNSVCLPLDFV